MKLNLDIFTKQKSVYILGMLNQILSGAISWLTMGIFVFSGITFWNTPTMDAVRGYVPWLTLWVFALILVAVGIFIMWLMHKIVQPSVMSYWNKMFYEQNNPMTAHLERIEKELLSSQKEIKEIKELIKREKVY